LDQTTPRAVRKGPKKGAFLLREEKDFVKGTAEI